MNEMEIENMSVGNEEQDDTDRESVLRHVLEHVRQRPDPVAHLVLLVHALDLGEELEQLAAVDPERHRRLDEVRQDLEELAIAHGLPPLEVGNE